MGFPSFFFKDLNKNPMIFVGEKGVCIKNIFMDFDQNKANGFYLLFKKKKVLGFKRSHDFYENAYFFQKLCSFKRFFLKESPTW